MWRKLGQLAHHPVVNALVGVAMIVTAVFEIADDWLQPIFGVSVGVEHGLFVVGVLHTLKALPELVEGVQMVEGSEREIETEPRKENDREAA